MTRPPRISPNVTQNRVEVSIAPPQRATKRTSPSCGNVARKWASSVANVAGRWS